LSGKLPIKSVRQDKLLIDKGDTSGDLFKDKKNSSFPKVVDHMRIRLFYQYNEHISYFQCFCMTMIIQKIAEPIGNLFHYLNGILSMDGFDLTSHVVELGCDKSECQKNSFAIISHGLSSR
jgi:hypothetical protein